jgi:DNA-binding NarL/FixJ family response regulator
MEAIRALIADDNAPLRESLRALLAAAEEIEVVGKPGSYRLVCRVWKLNPLNSS